MAPGPDGNAATGDAAWANKFWKYGEYDVAGH